MLTQFLEEWFPALVGASIASLIIWRAAPHRRHLGTALVEVLAVTLAYGSRPAVLRVFPSVTDHGSKILISAAWAGLVMVPLFHFASRMRRRAPTIHFSERRRAVAVVSGGSRGRRR